MVQFFNDAGVATKVEPGGKIFPVSDRASDVLAALLRRLKSCGCELVLSEPLRKVEKPTDRNNGQFLLTTDHRQLTCQHLVVTTGGKSYPGSGTTGDGYAWMRAFGHTILTPRPALTPVTTDEEWVRRLKGVTLKDVRLSLTDCAGRQLAQARGGFLFTHFGLSGPVALDLSRTITGHEQPRQLRLVCDFLPEMPEQDFALWLQSECQQAGKRQLVNVLTQVVPKRLAESILELASIDREFRCAEFSKTMRKRLTQLIKANIISVSGTRGFKKAEVTAGGVSLKEVDSRTMQSRICSGLYIAGEILDLDGPIGGYNFQAAFSTGWLAGQSI